MSRGGGAGKVYFVLYLAVVLELLIIIVERDEAEEGLLKKQKETMKIVESILSQLQSGAGTEGINTRPQDEITIPPPGIIMKDVIGADVKPYRKYIIEVGVTDISTAIKRKEGETDKEHMLRIKKLIELGNVEELEYQIFYNANDNPNNAPLFLSEEEIRKQKLNFTKFVPGQKITAVDGSEWEFKGIRKLVLDKEQTFNNLDLQNLHAENIHPVYPKNLEVVIGPNFAPPDVKEDSIFYYSESESGQPFVKGKSGELQKRAFMVNFQPSSNQGWFKLRFASRTNRILGVRGGANIDEVPDETTVNIGTVQLTVKDLRKVQKELTATLEKYKLPNFEEFARSGKIEEFDTQLEDAINNASAEEDAAEIISKIRLFGYIAKLLAPGMSSSFLQNQGAIEFNVHVLTPHPTIAEPTVTVPDYNACFDKIAAVIEFEISPYQGEAANAVEGRIVDNNGTTVARIDCRALDKIAGTNVSPPVNGGKRFYRGYVDKEITPGKYKIEITHKLAGKAKTDDQSVLEIFNTSLTDDSRKRLENRLSILTYYGYPITVDAEPMSGGKIKANQFRIYLATNRNNQPAAIEGLSNADNPLKPTCQDDKISLRISWVQPYTGAELDIFPLKSYELKQEPPEIITNVQPDYSGNANKLKVDVSGIQISKPISGCEGQEVQLEVKVGKLEKGEGLKTYDAPIEPSIEEEAGGYRVYFELQGKLPPGERKMTGSVSIPIYAKATNPNGKVSEEIQTDLSVRINYEPGQERKGPKRPGR